MGWVEVVFAEEGVGFVCSWEGGGRFVVNCLRRYFGGERSTAAKGLEFGGWRPVEDAARVSWREEQI